MDKLDWILLKEISTKKSIYKASESLYMTQPAASYRLTRMEKEYGVTLFVRSNHGIKLTNAGNRLLSFAENMIQVYEDIRDYVIDPDSQKLQNIKIGCFVTFGNYYLPLQIKDYILKNPTTQISIKTCTSTEIKDMLQRGELLIGVIRGNYIWDGSCEKILSEPVIIISSKPITDKMFKDTPILSLSSDTGTKSIVEQWILEQDIHISNSLIDCSKGTRNLPALVRQGIGWTTIPLSRIDEAKGLFCSPLYKKDSSLYMLDTSLCFSKSIEYMSKYKKYKTHFVDFFSKTVMPKIEDYNISADKPYMGA